ncbi:ATP-binding protein [Aerosakkonema funiforme]|uniref:ATP-binding protein n=1 Tax=Aerosakkonema funiforme FACHB-1375 TaxID=2949571 RepID=A0A926VI58_9CYAN|nr:AAA family ATPase [Aerosakkonema funiforme]MBD2184315.1 ATP-binding protein [Aerosakkonema funiforme FACHB-1375]
MDEIFTQDPKVETENGDWYEANRLYLIAAIAQVEETLRRHATPNLQLKPTALRDAGQIAAAMSPPPALEKFCNTFNLLDFDRDLLLLCAGMELDANWGNLCAAAAGNSQQTYPTFSLALRVLLAPDWAALTHDAPLRWWQAIQVGPGNSLMQSPLRIDERVLHYLLGIEHRDERLVNYVDLVPNQDIQEIGLPPSHRYLVNKIAGVLGSTDGLNYQIVQLCGSDLAEKTAIAAAACTMHGWNLHAMAADRIPTDTDDLANLMRLWEREALLSNSVLLLECDAVDPNDQNRDNAIARLIENSNNPLIVSVSDRRHPRKRPLIAFDVEKATSSEQQAIWRSALGELAESVNGCVEKIVANFNLSSPAIYATCREVQSQNETREELDVALWEVCRVQARSRMDGLAQRIESAATWDDLVLPDEQRYILREIVANVRQRTKVYESWGFADKSTRGLGISVLFAGASGTGKTMAADIIAKELRLDLYRIDLSATISKYIGETEKNLRRIFDAAEAGGCLLLFDEADALFGKRSQVKDSHDRYANLEISYLLQRMESYRGLAILTTNLKDSIDRAFLRRLRFAIEFPFPDAEYRQQIWQRIFPTQTPTQGLDFGKLAQLNVAGGNIRNIALNAAFTAADAGESVMMKHILQAAKSEYIKLERPLTDMEVKEWV